MKRGHKKTAVIETQKRLKILRDFQKSAEKGPDAIILVGSVAYSANHDVKPESDLDLLLVYEDLDNAADQFIADDCIREHIKNQMNGNDPYDGFMLKHKIGDVDVSIHCLSFSALEKIAEARMENLNYYRSKSKDITYYSTDFDGTDHPFKVTNIPVEKANGVKRIDPIAFDRDGHFVIGNDIDKILSNAIIVADKNDRAKSEIEKLWQNVARKLIEHAARHGIDLDCDNLDIGRILCRRDKFNKASKHKIRKNTRRAVREVVKKDTGHNTYALVPITKRKYS